MEKRLEIGVLGFILCLYGILAWGYATRTPDWQIPDEPAHYNYIRQIVDTGELPVIEMGDWDQSYLDTLRSNNFSPDVTADIERVEYEDHQPPLYYLLQSIIFQISDGDLITMRLFSAFLGGVVIISAWAAIRRIFPHQPWLGLSAAAFIAFLPQRLSIMAGVSNDSLAEMVAGLTSLMIVDYLLRTPNENQKWWQERTLWLGILVGIAFITKTTIYYLSAIAGLAILLRWWREKWSFKSALKPIMLFAIPALLMGAIWWIHGLQVYGGTDFLGLQRHDEVVVGQLRTDDYVNLELGGSQRLYVENLTETTFHSFWGQFGWMALPMKTNIYRMLLLVVIGIGIGIILYAIQKGWFKSLSKPQKEIFVLFVLTIVLVFAQFLIYNRTFVQFQGRYLYPALIPLALWVVLGLSGWSNLLTRWQPKTKWLPLPATLLMVFFAWYALRNVISVLPTWK